MTRPVKHVGIVGAGTMGAGIMMNCVTSGLPVMLVDRNPDVLEAARSKLDRYLARQVEKGRLDSADVPTIRGRVDVSVEMSALSRADLVIEAVFENLDLKRRVFRDLEKAAPPTAILASNTSCLRITDIAEALERPERFFGMHYFSPAEINTVVELIEGPVTAPEVLNTAARFLTATGKDVIACKDRNGFALNRFFCPYTNEAVRLLDDGLASPGQIDESAKEVFGLALGPFAVMNIIGTSTNLNAVRSLAPMGAFYEPARALTEHGEENRPWAIDPAPAPLPAPVAATISDRLIGSVLLPVTELLAEGTASLDDIDRGASRAFRFTRTPGQLLRELGPDRTAELVALVARARPPAAAPDAPKAAVQGAEFGNGR